MNKKIPLSLQDSLFIGFCATLLVALTSILRLKLGLSGHSMLLMSFFYLICYGAIGRFGGITACGVIAGIVAMALGVGKGGPMILLKFALPALAMDCVGLLLPLAMHLRWRCVSLALTGSLAWALKGALTNMLAGMALKLVFIQWGLSALKGGVFAILGALLVPPVLARLVAHDLLQRDKC
ncbi:MAG: core component of ECF transporter [Shewanella sp.]|uniref:core component of ECF transporter n=1 Tax=Shewanella sp. TaxID=50422 RepID=UPI003F360B98